MDAGVTYPRLVLAVCVCGIQHQDRGAVGVCLIDVDDILGLRKDRFVQVTQHIDANSCIGRFMWRPCVRHCHPHLDRDIDVFDFAVLYNMS